MAFSDYFTTPAQNITIGGKNVAEGCPSGNINDALRQLASDGKLLSNTVGALSSGMPVTGGTFTGDILRSGRGGYLHHSNANNASGRIFVQAVGGVAPGMANGDWLAEY